MRFQLHADPILFRSAFRLFSCMILSLSIGCGRALEESGWRRVSLSGMHIETVAGTGASNLLMEAVREGKEKVEGFFGRPFKSRFTVRIFPDRNSLTSFWRETWGMPDFEAQCWMVGSATARVLSLLDPGVWKTQACEHDPEDTVHVKDLVAHELMHVYHGQHSPNPEFDGMDPVGWFVEGIAVLVSGQLTAERIAGVRRVLEEGGPDRLEDVWTGSQKYGLAGSLVAYVESRYGRETLYRMLEYTTEQDMLARLGLSEEILLASWKSSVLSPEDGS